MHNIKLLNKISPSGLAVLDPGKFNYSDDVTNADGCIVRSLDLHDHNLPDSLRAIARAGAGVNNIPIDACTEKGIVVFNTPGANANAVKELTIAGLLISSRRIYPSIIWAQGLKGEGDKVADLVEKGKSQFTGPEISGKKLGIIGLGAIGVMVANAAINLGMEVYGYDPYLTIDAAWGLSRSVKHAKTLKEVYENCDFITLHVPSNNETRGMINSQSIVTMKTGVRILNFARGDLVESADVIEAVNDKKISCYVTDFPTDEMLGMPGIIPLPHLGASTPESEDNCAEMAAQQLAEFLENGNIRNSVNLPTVVASRTRGDRVTIIHKNIPNMISQISGVTGTATNIDNLTNKSRGEYAYTMMDIDGSIPADLPEKLKAIDGVIRVTVLK